MPKERERNSENLPIQLIALFSAHGVESPTCMLCGSAEAKVYRPAEIWGSTIKLRTENMPIYKCINPECGLENGDIQATIEFDSAALQILREVGDRGWIG